MAPRLETVPRHRVEALLQAALADPWPDLPLVPVNWGEWQRIDRLYRPLLEDLAQRVRRARSAEEVDALGRIAEGVVEQRQVELDELRRYVDPAARHEPEGPDSALLGPSAAQAIAQTQSPAGDGQPLAGEAGRVWQPRLFVGLAHLRPALTELASQFGDPGSQVALAAQLGFPFVATHTSYHQLAQRLLLEALIQPTGAEPVLWGPVPARFRPSWDVWAPRRRLIGSVQPDLRLSNLADFGSSVLWSRLVEAPDGLGYLVVAYPMDHIQGVGGAPSRDQVSEHLRRQRWQQMRLQAMAPRPDRRTAARARSAVSGLRSALRRVAGG